MSVAVVCGGPSREAEVSRSSGREVATALRESYPRVETFELSPDIGARLRAWEADVVFPVLHGPPGEDGTVQGFLEIVGLPYVGSGVRASACAMDKMLAKLLFRSAALPVADDVTIEAGRDVDAAVSRLLDELGDDVVIKPVAEGSAIGVSFAHGAEAVRRAVGEALRDDPVLLVERRVAGREITVGILDREDGPSAFPVIEIVTPEGSWYDYEHRYTPGLSEHLVPAPLPDASTREVQEIARRAHLVLGCRDLSRVDLVLSEEDGPVLLEVNTLPGMTPTSLYPDGAAAAGLSFPELVSHLVSRAASRGPSRARGPAGGARLP